MQGRVLLWLAASAVWGASSACGGEHAGTEAAESPLVSCEAVDGGACPAVQPSYAHDVVPILDRDCNQTCHAPGMAQWPLTNYSDVAAWSGLISVDLKDCAMPPADAGALTSSERTTLLGWLACGSPNN
jgi:hypothetical protein